MKTKRQYIKKNKRHIHIALEEPVMIKLEEYSTRVNKTMTAVVEDSLVALFKEASTQHIDMLKKLLDSFYMVVNSGFNYPSFFSCLYKLAKTYPEESTKEFWGENVYLLQKDLTHEEAFDEVKSRFNKIKEQESPTQ